MVSYSAKTGDLEQNPGCQSRETRRFWRNLCPLEQWKYFLIIVPCVAVLQNKNRIVPKHRCKQFLLSSFYLLFCVVQFIKCHRETRLFLSTE